MAYSIECPECGALNTPPSSLKFWRSNMNCIGCGKDINIKQSRMISKKCPGCEKIIVCDQKKLEKKKCPFCGTSMALGATAEYKMVRTTCPQCSCAIEVDKTIKGPVSCPVCDFQFELKQVQAKEKAIQNTGISIIKYEGDNEVLVWKHPLEDFNLGSKLIVHESQEAIFFMGGQALNTFKAGEHILDTQSLPILKSIYNSATEGVSPFHAEIYFINLTTQMAIPWGTDMPVGIIDPVYNVPIEIKGFGEMSLSVKDSRKLLIKLVGTTKGVSWSNEIPGFTKGLKSAFIPHIMPILKTYLSDTICKEKLDVFDIAGKLQYLSQGLRGVVSPLLEEFGLYVSRFSISNLVYNEDHKNYKKLEELRSVALLVEQEKAIGAVGVAKSQAGLAVDTEEVKRRRLEIETQAYEKVVSSKAEAASQVAIGGSEAQVMGMKGYTHKDELQAETQKAFAEGLGTVVANGGGGLASEMMGLGVALGVGGQVSKGITDNIIPNMQMQQSTKWRCSCGIENYGNNCTNCGAPKPEAWICPKCQTSGLTGNNCINCGEMKPQKWTCPKCNTGNQIGKYCSGCGEPKPVPEKDWTCTSCNTSGQKGKFCSICGSPKPANVNGLVCSKCGKADQSGKFCAECGAPLQAAPATWDCSCGNKGITTPACPDCGNKR